MGLAGLGWGRGEGGDLELEMRKLQRHLQAGGELPFFSAFGVCVFFFKRGWIDDELCGETFTSLQSNFCSRSTAGLSVLGSGRRALLAPASSPPGFPGAGGRELVGSRGSACLPGVAAHPHPNFCPISEPLGAVSFERKSPERR